jgi:serine/threonine-protein kinase HipA
VPKVWKMYVPQPVYTVERFDRVLTPGVSEAQRLHVIDACQLLNKARSFKYTAAQVGTLRQAAEQCHERAAARLRLFGWLLFNGLIGNGDNHLKNISFLIDSTGAHIAPAYDLLSTAGYDTRALADEKAHWPGSPLAIPFGDAQTFADVRRQHLMEAARVLGIAAATGERMLDRMLETILKYADVIINQIERQRAAPVRCTRGR